VSALQIAPVSFDYDGAAAATGLSRDVIARAVKAGDLNAHYPEVNGRQLAKPVIDVEDLRTWIRRGKTARKPAA
jgi:hypothetical protein